LRSFLRISFLLIFINSIAGATCQYKYEEKDSTVSTIKAYIQDYTDSVYYPASAWSYCSKENSICVLLGANQVRYGALTSWVEKDTTSTWVICNNLYYGDPLYGTVKRCEKRTKAYSRCPGGYSPQGIFCRNTQNYTYTRYTCDATDKNTQGFGWELTDLAINDGSKIDGNIHTINDLTSPLSSHTSLPKCKRKYQECTIDCVPPLVLDVNTSRCVMDYNTSCIDKGMVYNLVENKCEENNQCGYVDAFKDLNSSYCIMDSDCLLIDGVCAEEPLYGCSGNLLYNSINEVCQSQTECLLEQKVLSNFKCGSNPYCNSGDVLSSTTCVHTVDPNKTCGADLRDGNLCYVQSSGDKAISYYRPLIKSTFTGTYKEKSYGDILPILCTDSSSLCTFRLTRMFSDNNGTSLCFEDSLGVIECIDVAGECLFNGEISSIDGIKQLNVENGNTITGYNLSKSSSSLGSITSTCSLDGKVGNFQGSYKSFDIISVVANENELKFWDPYTRGFIGVISIIPTIPDIDTADGFVYDNPEVYLLMNKGFKSFYSENNDSVFAVYDGMISKDSCQDLILGTSFFITQAQTPSEQSIMKGLNYKSSSNYNFNDGDFLNGSCVIKSEIAQSLKFQTFSTKKTVIPDAASIFVCSSLSCSDHFCQYNECPTGFNGGVYYQSYFDSIVAQDFPDALSTQVCQEQQCDNNKPHYRYCGNEYGCEISPDVYQQSDGTCVSAICRSDEVLNPTTGKCEKFSCVNSVERNGVCYKSLY